MKNITRSLLMLALTVGMLYFSAVTEVSAQAAQDFHLINKTGVEINALYISPHSTDDWEEDILGVETLAADDELDISFSRSEKARLWDLRIEDEDGSYIVWENLNLLTISNITLYYKNGKATAVVE